MEYRIYVNGHFKTSTKRDAKTRALVENISPQESYRISVRTVTVKGMSEDAACTLNIGKGKSTICIIHTVTSASDTLAYGVLFLICSQSRNCDWRV